MLQGWCWFFFLSFFSHLDWLIPHIGVFLHFLYFCVHFLLLHSLFFFRLYVGLSGNGTTSCPLLLWHPHSTTHGTNKSPIVNFHIIVIAILGFYMSDTSYSNLHLWFSAQKSDFIQDTKAKLIESTKTCVTITLFGIGFSYTYVKPTLNKLWGSIHALSRENAKIKQDLERIEAELAEAKSIQTSGIFIAVQHALRFKLCDLWRNSTTI